METDSHVRCWLCNCVHEDDCVVEIDVRMPAKAVVCIDCVDCVLKWGNVEQPARNVALNKVEGHSIAALRTKAASDDHH